MRTHSKAILGICCCLLALSILRPAVGQITKLLEQFATEYKSTKTEHEKLSLCIRAIDSGLIARGAPVQNLDAIFGTNFVKEIPREGLEGDAIYFKHLPPVPNESYQADTSGWHLAVEFGSNGRITNYYISNLGK